MPRGKPFKLPLDEWYFQWFSMVKYTVQNTVGLITSKYHSMVLNVIEWYFQRYFNDIRQAPYKGPYRVLERRSKYFKLDLGSREDVVSVDRLKLAFLDEPVPDNQDAPYA